MAFGCFREAPGFFRGETRQFAGSSARLAADGSIFGAAGRSVQLVSVWCADSSRRLQSLFGSKGGFCFYRSRDFEASMATGFLSGG